MQSRQIKSLQDQAGYAFAGRHLLASYAGCDSQLISDGDHCLAVLIRAATESGVNIISREVHQFPNGAVTAVLLLAESHASIHTYPEHQSCFVDFFTCGKGDLEKFDAVMRDGLKSKDVGRQVIVRGAVER